MRLTTILVVAILVFTASMLTFAIVSNSRFRSHCEAAGGHVHSMGREALCLVPDGRIIEL